jgi:hypothetical protein
MQFKYKLITYLKEQNSQNSNLKRKPGGHRRCPTPRTSLRPLVSGILNKSENQIKTKL